MGKGYALISEKYIKGNGEDFHLFLVDKIKKYEDDTVVDIRINKYSKCKKESNNINFYDLKQKIIEIKGKKKSIYKHYYKDNVFYFEDEKTARLYLAIVGRHACGICVSTLYKNIDYLNLVKKWHFNKYKDITLDDFFSGVLTDIEWKSIFKNGNVYVIISGILPNKKSMNVELQIIQNNKFVTNKVCVNNKQINFKGYVNKLYKLYNLYKSNK